MNVTFDDLKNRKVKLEFGNKEQIAAIDKVQQAKEEAEQWAADEAAGNLKTFEVRFRVSGYTTVRVKARDKNDAEELAWDQADPEDNELMELDLCTDPEIEELEE